MSTIPCSLDTPRAEGTPDAFLHAERLQALIKPVAAEGAFLGPAISGTEADGRIRAGVAAGLTSIAFLTVNEDNSIRPLKDSPFCRAGLQAGRILAVPAGVDLPGEAESRVLANRHIRGCAPVIEHLDPRPCLNLILGLAGNHARAAPDASSGLKDQAMLLGHLLLLSLLNLCKAVVMDQA
jgi:hypothetical protein